MQRRRPDLSGPRAATGEPAQAPLQTGMSRRGWLRAGQSAAFGAVVLALTGCGFQLRREPALPFKRIALSGFGARSGQAAALRRAAGADAEFVSTPAQAEVVLVALAETRQRGIGSLTVAGQVRELRLVVTLRYRVLGSDGQEWLGPTVLSQSRDMTYNETDALAKELEEGQLVRDMEADIARQVVSQLSTLRRP